MSNYLIEANVYGNLGNMFLRLKNTESWRGKIPTQEGFSKEDKEALNVIIFAFLKDNMLEDDSTLESLPAYILKRLYKKAYTWDAKPDNMEFLRRYVPDFDNELDSYVSEKMVKEGVGELARFIDEESAKISPKVLRVYKAARVLGTLVEYEEMKDKLRPDTVEETYQQVYRQVEDFAKELPHFGEIAHGIGEYAKLKTLIKAISCSRYTFRWQGYISPVRCSILSHMLESAVISYLMNLETGRKTDKLQDFWVMMFHDIAEIWSDDIPSPVKDGMRIVTPTKELFSLLEKKYGITLRDISGYQEKEVLEKHFYSCLPTGKLVDFFKHGVMLEDVTDKEIKKFYKSADYFSADLEVYWNIKGGAREYRFKEILVEDSKKVDDRTPAEISLLESYVSQCESVTFLN